MSKLTPSLVKSANVEVENTGESFELFDFLTVTGQHRQIRIDRARARSVGHVHHELLAANAILPSDPTQAAQLIQDAIDARVKRCLKYASTLGWRPDRCSFVLPDRVVGAQDVLPPYKLTDDARARFSRAGSLKAWQDHVATPAGQSPSLVLLIAAAFAAPLLRDSSLANFGINLFGLSQQARRVAAMVATSVVGRDPSRDVCDWWSSSAVVLDAVQEHADLLFVAAGGSAAGKAASPAERAARLRQLQSGDLGRGRQPDRWHGLYVSLLNQANDRPPLDEPPYCLELGADGHTLGLGFLKKHRPLPGDPHVSEQQWLRDLLRHSSAYYGKPLRPYLRYLIEDGQNLRKRAASHRRRFRILLVGTNTRANRLEVKRFALLYAAAALAIDAGVLPWQADRMAQALITCLKAVGEHRRFGRLSGSKIRRLLAKRLQEPMVVQRQPGDRFGPEEHAGFYRVVDGQNLYTVQAVRFRAWFERPAACCDALLWLHKRGLLELSGPRVVPTNTATQWAERTLRWPDGTVQRSVTFRWAQPSASEGPLTSLPPVTPPQTPIV